jgi:hypothetical protein
MPRRTALAVVASVAVLGVLAGCSGGSSGGGSPSAHSGSDPAAVAELANGIAALGDASTISASLKLDATGQQLLSFVRLQDPSASLTTSEASLIAGLDISVQAQALSGQTIADIGGIPTLQSAAVSAVEGNKTLFAIRLVNQALYLKVAVQDLLDALGKQATYRKVEIGAAKLPPYASAFLLHNQWVSVALSVLKSIPGVGSVLTASPPSVGSHGQLLAKVETLLTKDVTVTETTTGDNADLTLTANLRTLAGDAETTLAGSLPSTPSSLSAAKLASLPDRDVSLTATVTNGTLSKVTFDLGQLAAKAGGSLPIVLTLSTGGPPTAAPTGATAVDLSGLIRLALAFDPALANAG